MTLHKKLNIKDINLLMKNDLITRISDCIDKNIKKMLNIKYKNAYKNTCIEARVK